MASKPRKDTVLITGAGRGLGLETALTLAERGYRVWAGLRNLHSRSHAEAAARDRGVELEFVQLDVTDPASVDAALATVLKKAGSLYGLVNNAGITARAYFEDFPEEEIRRIFETNLFGVMNVTRRVLPYMRSERRGRIIMLSSIGGRIGSIGIAPYAASKFALEGFSESLALELKPLGLRVVIVEPGIVKTDIWEHDNRVLPTALNPQSPYYRWFCKEEKLAELALKTSRNKPADVAGVICHALSAARPRLRYVVGKRAGSVLWLRRHLPGELFEKFYFGEVLRRVTRPDA